MSLAALQENSELVSKFLSGDAGLLQDSSQRSGCQFNMSEERRNQPLSVLPCASEQHGCRVAEPA
jgi:hypothetical protein